MPRTLKIVKSVHTDTNKCSIWDVVVVSMLAFYSDDPSLNPAEVHSFYSVNCWTRMRKNEKEAGDGQFKKTIPTYAHLDLFVM